MTFMFPSESGSGREKVKNNRQNARKAVPVIIAIFLKSFNKFAPAPFKKILLSNIFCLFRYWCLNLSMFKSSQVHTAIFLAGSGSSSLRLQMDLYPHWEKQLNPYLQIINVYSQPSLFFVNLKGENNKMNCTNVQTSSDSVPAAEHGHSAVQEQGALGVWAAAALQAPPRLLYRPRPPAAAVGAR